MSFTKVSGNFLEDNISVGIATAATLLNVGVTTFHSTTAFVHDVNSTGVVTATAFYGDGTNLTGVDSTTLKDTDGNVRVRANTSGAVVTGVATVPFVNAEIIGYDNVLNNDIRITSATRTAIIYVDQDLTVDIEEGTTISIDDGCYLNIIT